MIIKQLQLGADKVFCYILACEESREAVVIDPCGGDAKVLTLIQELQLKPLFIVNTHFHPDHTCGNRAVKEASGAEIVMHEADELLLHDLNAKEYFDRLGFPTPPPVDRTVHDGDLLVFGKYSLSIIHTPGHSPGSICLYTEGNLFTGDSLFVGAAGRVDVPGGDFTTLIESLTAKIAVLPEETIIWPGHDYGDSITSTVGREKKENPYLGGEW
ncbi:MAG: MBL fold metallo-hydrolase [Deltaproteobacteria bacterium]|jgi:glyoxylase-like metal-dependent hydrolase (beta-lactamase superfamily II)|nr:MBL fold metallo-hydrolase [Deltaproteobacteria bacterium]